MKFCDERIQKHLLNGGKIKNTTFGGSYIIYIDNNCVIKKDNDEDYTLKGQDLSSDKWEIVETSYDWNKIIKDKILCVFCNMPDYKDVLVSTLIQKEGNNHYYMAQGIWFKYCKPFNPKDFNIAKNLKEYEK